MHRYVSTVILCLIATVSTASEVPPLEVPVGQMIEGIACAHDPSQTYTLYLPSTFTNDRRWPLILVFDARGRSRLGAELFRQAAERYGWIIVSSDNTRSDGPWDPNVRAIQALWPEVHYRLPTDFDRIYAAGFSGGAAVATLLAKTTGEVAGIVACGGRLFENQFEDSDVAVFSTAGTTDFNFLEMHQLDDFLEERGNPHRLAIFEGDHSWMPPSMAQVVVGWFELLAMKKGVRDRDPEIIRALYEEELAGARSLIAQGRAVEAVRGIRETERTYEGLYDVSEAKAIADGIETTDQYERQFKKTRRIQDFEMRCLQRRNVELTKLRNSDVPPPTRKLAGDLYLKDLKRDALRSDDEGMAAQRCLNSLYAALAYYFPLSELPKRKYPQVATSYELALMIRDDSPVVWYNLGCVRVQLGRESLAVEALARALDLGFDRYEMMRTDPDFEALRKRKDFRLLLASIAD